MEKVAVVTGFSGGLGRAVVERFLRDKWRVAASSLGGRRAVKTGEWLADREEQVLVDRCDVRSEEEVRQWFGKIMGWAGQIDCLVHCAGVGQNIRALDMGIDEWDRVIGINLRGSFLLCRECAKAMTVSGGCIVLVSSLSGAIGFRDELAYGVSKAGVEALTRGLAVELAEYRIRVNAVAPTWFESSMVESVLGVANRKEEEERLIPLGHIGEPGADVVGPIMFLCSDDARYVTGEVLRVDGGKGALLGR